MSRTSLLSLLCVLAVIAAVGLLLVGRPTPATAQGAPAPAEAPVDVKALVTPSPVVSAVPFQQRTEYEQDPFDTTRLRRTTTTVTQVMLVHADGSMEIKEAR